MSGRRVELSGTQVIASVLAAVTGAIVASSLGVAGTVIGVAVVSFASTAGSAIYRHFLGRTRERLRAAARAHLPAADGPRSRGNGRAGGRGPAPGGKAYPQLAHLRGLREARPAPPSGGPTGETWILPAPQRPGGRNGQSDGPGHKREAAGGGPPGPAGWLGRNRWAKYAGLALLVFLLAMGGITILEAATGKPLSALIWGGHSTGTTVGNVVHGQAPGSRPATPRQTPPPRHKTRQSTPSPTMPATPTPSPGTTSPSPTPSPSATGTPTATPSPSGSRTTGTPATPRPPKFPGKLTSRSAARQDGHVR